MLKHSKISDYKIKKILKCFCADITASKTAQLLSINRNTINRFYQFFREKIAFASLKEMKVISEQEE